MRELSDPAARAAGHRRTGRRRRIIRPVRAAAALALAAGLAACSSSSGGSASSTLIFADVAPFSGVDAALGPIYLVSCTRTADAINTAGGILGHQVACK